MTIDTPATIAILGAGPLGLEAGLYARFLGYQVALYERGAVCEHVRQRADTLSLTPFSENCSRLGLAALGAQDPRYRPPASSAVLTGQQWLDAYLLPLAASDLLADCLHEQTTVLRVSQVEAVEAVGPGRRTGPAAVTTEDEGEGEDEEMEVAQGFHVWIRERDGRERCATAQAVINATGEPALLQPTVHGYIVGAQCGSGVEQFSFADGLRQIRDLFAILGGRADLDLYATIKL